MPDLTPLEASRRQRRHSIAQVDQRTQFQRDRDRILYSSAFRRLAGITQIVRTGESDVFHTRQQHTAKVAQVGRRIAEHLRYDDRKEKEEQVLLAAEIELHPDVVEAACLAHDLGHPPFGHIGEDELNSLVRAANCADGFEGNAQSFRILTKLAVRYDECDGLDLTRGTLLATLKYPWMQEPNNPARAKKWGSYRSEAADFEFALLGQEEGERSVEAALMDWADDIAYSVHDLEDFQRCAALPWARIFASRELIVQHAAADWFDKPPGAEGLLRDAFRALETLLKRQFDRLIEEPYEGSRVQRQQLRTMTSSLISRYLQSTSLRRDNGKIVLDVPQDIITEVKILKQITRDYIIGNPALAGQQHGQRKIIRTLFYEIHQNIKLGRSPPYPAFLPTRLRLLWDLCDGEHARFVCDCIASLTEAEAIGLHSRLTGAASGSVLDPIVR